MKKITDVSYLVIRFWAVVSLLLISCNQNNSNDKHIQKIEPIKIDLYSMDWNAVYPTSLLEPKKLRNATGTIHIEILDQDVLSKIRQKVERLEKLSAHNLEEFIYYYSPDCKYPNLECEILYGNGETVLVRYCGSQYPHIGKYVHGVDSVLFSTFLEYIPREYWPPNIYSEEGMQNHFSTLDSMYMVTGYKEEMDKIFPQKLELYQKLMRK